MRRASFAISVLLIVLTTAAYWPVFNAQFVNCDDPAYVSQNAHVLQGLTGENVHWAFTSFAAQFWHPLTWLSHMLDVELFGANPAGHHATNLFLHLLNALLLFAVLKRATKAVWPSTCVAGLFSLHPLHVESVAWVAERKDLLSAFFFLVALWFYTGFAKSRLGRARFDTRNYLLSLLAFALGLMSKPMVVTLPFVLLLLDFWPFSRFSRRGTEGPKLQLLVWEKIPFFALTIADSIVAYIAQQAGNSLGSLDKFPLGGRLAHSLVSYLLYLKKALVPTALSVFYPHPGTWPASMTAAAAATLLAITALAVWQLKKRPWLIVGWFWFLGALVPVIGLVQVGSHAMADRYTYIPLIGLFLAIVWTLADFGKRSCVVQKAGVLLGAIALAACVALTTVQTRNWRDSQTLFGHALKIAPDNYFALVNLGVALIEKGDKAQAESCFAKAVQLKPDFAPAHVAIANIYRIEGRTQEAIEHYERALRLAPRNEQAHYNYGSLLALEGNVRQAEEHLSEALRLRPDWGEAHARLGYLLCLRGQTSAGVQEYKIALRLRPDGQTHLLLGEALVEQKNWREAIQHFRAAIGSLPNDPVPLGHLASILATQDDPKLYDPTEAVSLAAKACELTRHADARLLDILAIAYSEAGRFDDAVKTAEQGVATALGKGDTELAADIRARAQCYRQKQSYRSFEAKEKKP